MKVLDFGYHAKGIDKLNFKSHSHPQSLEIIQVINGGGNFFICDKQFTLEKYCIFLVNGNNLHFSSPTLINDYCRNKIVIQTNDLYKFLSSINSLNIIDQLFNNLICIKPNQSQSINIDMIFNRINEQLSNKKQNYQLNIAILILEMLKELTDIKKEGSKTDNVSSRAMEYISNHISETINLDKICSLFKMSKSNLCHSFKQSTGMTILEYSLQLRLSLAKKQLIETNMPIIDIAYNNGFSTFSYFCSIFRKYEKISPSKYRKLNTK